MTQQTTAQTLQCRRLKPEARLPTRGTGGSAGLDLYACLPEGDLVITPGEVQKIPTGLAIHIADRQLVGIIAVRSGLATKRHATLINAVGVIDSDYQGELIVTLINHSENDLTIAHHERFAQLLLMPCVLAVPQEVESFAESERGSAGHGSTGRF